MSRYFYIIICFLVTESASATDFTCTTKDQNFHEFLTQFIENPIFQKKRIVFPLAARFGDYRLAEPKIYLWSQENISALSYPIIYTKQQMETKNLHQTILLETDRYSEVFQDVAGEGDFIRILFKFRNISGCWFLEEFHDKSL